MLEFVSQLKLKINTPIGRMTVALGVACPAVL